MAVKGTRSPCSLSLKLHRSWDGGSNTQSLWKPGNPTLTIQPTAEVTEPLEKVEPRCKPGKRLNQNQLQGNIFAQILSHHFFSPTRFCWYAVKSAFLENAHASPQQSAVSFINLMQTRVLKFRERTLHGACGSHPYVQQSCVTRLFLKCLNPAPLSSEHAHNTQQSELICPTTQLPFLNSASLLFSLSTDDRQERALVREEIMCGSERLLRWFYSEMVQNEWSSQSLFIQRSTKCPSCGPYCEVKELCALTRQNSIFQAGERRLTVLAHVGHRKV